MRIAIQTLPLHTNFGGILQAYALQRVLQSMGHEVYVIDVKRDYSLPLLKAPLVWAFRFVKKYILGNKNCYIFFEKKYPILHQHTQRFIDSYINKLPCDDYSKLEKNCVDAIVVGSDQVWRPQYFDLGVIEDAYLQFAQNWNIKRVSYAASFGTDKWEYSEKQTIRCRKLISMFDAVSVREDSAVSLCKENFGIEAVQLLDPTLLLEKEEYINLVERTEMPKSDGDLMVYLLDESEDKLAVVKKVADELGLKSFNTKQSDNIYSTIEERTQPPVEEWIRAFMNAKFVIADSFHACVFSIIFNKPFIAYGNLDRGAARFHSLLSMFDLEDQFISSAKEFDLNKLNNIDWDRVNRKHLELKGICFDFLGKI